MRRRFVACLFAASLFVAALAANARAGDVNRELYRLFKGTESIEKIELRTGKEAIRSGEQYAQVVVFTVNSVYSNYDAETLTSLRERVWETLHKNFKTEKTLIVFQDQHGHVYEARDFDRLRKDK